MNQERISGFAGIVGLLNRRNIETFAPGKVKLSAAVSAKIAAEVEFNFCYAANNTCKTAVVA